MLNTLEASFAQCRYFLLTGGYFNAVCSDAPQIYLPGETVAARLAGSEIDALFARYGFAAGLRTTMAALELDFGARFFERGTDLLNTLDHPAIEFVVARERDATETMTRLGDMIAANIEFQRQTGFGSEACACDLPQPTGTCRIRRSGTGSRAGGAARSEARRRRRSCCRRGDGRAPPRRRSR